MIIYISYSEFYVENTSPLIDGLTDLVIYHVNSILLVLSNTMLYHLSNKSSYSNWFLYAFIHTHQYVHGITVFFRLIFYISCQKLELITSLRSSNYLEAVFSWKHVIYLSILAVQQNKTNILKLLIIYIICRRKTDNDLVIIHCKSEEIDTMEIKW